MNSKRKGTLLAASIGSTILVFILVFGTIWSGNRARNDTESAVRSPATTRRWCWGSWASAATWRFPAKRPSRW